MKTGKAERIAFLESIYDSYRSEPAIQLDIRRELIALRGRRK